MSGIYTDLLVAIKKARFAPTYQARVAGLTEANTRLQEIMDIYPDNYHLQEFQAMLYHAMLIIWRGYHWGASYYGNATTKELARQMRRIRSHFGNLVNLGPGDM